MIIYIVLIALTTIFALLSYISNNNYKKYNVNKYKTYSIIFAFFSFLIPTIISSIRDYSIGTDVSGTYLDIYNIIKEGKNIRDYGYGILNSIAIFIFDDYRGVLIITSVIINSLVFLSIFKESKDPAFSAFLYFTTNVFFISMNMIRQSLATVIFIYSIKFIKEKHWIRYYFAIILAILIHSSAVIYLPMYFIFNKKITRKKVISFSIVFATFGTVITSLIIEILYKLSFFKNYFSWYFESVYNTGKTNWISLLIIMAILLFLLYIYKKANDDKDYNILLWSMLISFCMLMISSKIPLIQRTSWLFSFSLFVYLPNMFKYIKNKRNRFLLKTGVLLCYTLYMGITIFILGYHDVYPYVSMFS